jgi:uncharacterized membrane protein
MRIFWKIIFCILVFGIAGYAAFAYIFRPLGAAVHPGLKDSFLAHPLGIYLHIFPAIIALALGPLQLSSNLRDRRLRLHRWIGRIYLGAGVLIGGTAGLYMAQFAFGGTIAQLGFALLAISWLYTGLRAYLYIRKGNIDCHRKWMIRNYSLTFAAVTLRLYIPLSFLMGIEFEIAYRAVAWLCWIPNIILAEWLFNQQKRPFIDYGIRENSQ